MARPRRYSSFSSSFSVGGGGFRLRFRFLTAAQVMRLYACSIVPRGRPTQPAYLASAVASPAQHHRFGGGGGRGGERRKDVFALAGVLAEKIVRNHAYQDGNKRASLAAADVFLRLNGYRLGGRTGTEESRGEEGEGRKGEDQLVDAHIAVAANRWDAEQLGALYRRMATKTSGAGRGSETVRGDE